MVRFMCICPVQISQTAYIGLDIKIICLHTWHLAKFEIIIIRWKEEPFDEMDSTLAVQQYIQQTIRKDPKGKNLKNVSSATFLRQTQ